MGEALTGIMVGRQQGCWGSSCSSLQEPAPPHILGCPRPGGIVERRQGPQLSRTSLGPRPIALAPLLSSRARAPWSPLLPCVLPAPPKSLLTRTENSEPHTPLLSVVTPWVARWGAWAAAAAGPTPRDPDSQGPFPLGCRLYSVLVQPGSPHRLFLAVRHWPRAALKEDSCLFVHTLLR